MTKLSLFDYEALEADTRRYVAERAEGIHNIARMTAAGIVKIGQYLSEVKERLKHGQFLQWLDQEFGWVERSAQRFMSVHQHVKCDNLSDLQIDVSALYLIAAQKTPEPVRQQLLCRAENGELVTFSGARALVEHFAETGEMPDIQVDLKKMIAEQRREVSPPVEQTAAEKREEQQDRAKRAANMAKVSARMMVIEGIEAIAETELPMPEIARYIERFNTPDQDWPGAVVKSLARLKELLKELKR